MFLLPAFAFGTNADSLLAEQRLRLKQREVRNYIRPTLSFSIFNTGLRDIRKVSHTPVLNDRLGQYQFFESSLSFYSPLYTRTKFTGPDSTRIKTFHLLFTINALTDRPTFSGLEKQHELYKLAVGVRGIWAWKKSILFVDATPFITGDKYNDQSTAKLRLGTTFVYNRMVGPRFSWRVGITKTFIYGNKLFLPMVGFRVGKLDGKCYFQFQLPRYISLTFQPTPKFSFNIYSKVYGGVYDISNGDSLYVGSDSVIQFGHFGIANGVRFDFRPGPNVSFFFGGGLAMRNYIWLYSYQFNQANNLQPFDPFYKGRPDGTLYLNFGVTVRFGKSKRSQGNYLMYDVFDLNNTMDPGDNNNNPGNGDIRRAADEAEMQKVQYKDVEDLVDETDLY